MRVISMGVFSVVVVMTVRVIVVMMVVVVIFHIQTAFPGAEVLTQITGFHRGAGRICPLPFYVMVMAFLYRAHFGLEPQNLGAVFAHGTIGRRGFLGAGIVTSPWWLLLR